MEFAASDQTPRIVESDARTGDTRESDGVSSNPVQGPDSEVPAEATAFAAPEETGWSRVRRALAWYRWLVLLAVLVPATALGGIGLWLWLGWVWAAGWVALCVAMAAVGGFVAGAVRNSWGYAEGRTDLYLTYGVAIRQLIVVPYGRMQVVDVTSNLLEQVLGIATVRVRTAATTADTRIPGLRFNDAVVLRDRLATRSETFSTGL